MCRVRIAPEFVNPGTPVEPSRYFARFSVSLCAGLAVFGLATFVAWRDNREARGLRFAQYFTQISLKNLDNRLLITT